MTSTLPTNSRLPLDYKKMPPFHSFSIMSGIEEDETFDTTAGDMILEENIEEVQHRLDQVAETEEEVRMMKEGIKRKLEVVV